jgi:hypothetical protein
MVARVLCCLFVDLIWRNFLYIACGKGGLIQVFLAFLQMKNESLARPTIRKYEPEANPLPPSSGDP